MEEETRKELEELKKDIKEIKEQIDYMITRIKLLEKL